MGVRVTDSQFPFRVLPACSGQTHASRVTRNGEQLKCTFAGKLGGMGFPGSLTQECGVGKQPVLKRELVSPRSELGGGKNPWGERGRRQRGLPVLERLLSDLAATLRRILGAPDGGKPGGSGFGFGTKHIRWLVVILLTIWGIAGIYIIEPPEQGVVLRLVTMFAPPIPARIGSLFSSNE